MFKRLAPGYQLPPICASLVQQVEAWPQAEFLYQSDCGGIPTGTKLRHLTELARGRFISTVDDDDDISDVYVPELLNAIRESPDVDVITFDMHFRGTPRHPRPSGVRYAPTSAVTRLLVTYTSRTRSGVVASCPS
jgi:hypothetical protein